jgi:opine dehydrogenase
MTQKQKKPVAILGGGACAQTFAADFTLAGYEVRLYELPEFVLETLGEVLHTRQIELSGKQHNFKWFRRTGIAKVNVITTDIAEAIKGAGLIIVSVPANGHKALFKKMLPYLENDQIISIFPDNFGSLVLREMMREKDHNVNIVIGGWNSMPYGVRKTSPGKIDCILRIHRLMYDTLPTIDRDKFFQALKEIPPFEGTSVLERGDTVIGIGLSNPNPVVHAPGSILSVGPMEVSQMEESTLNISKGRFSMYKHGMSPAVSRVQFAFYQDICNIASAMGIKIVEYSEEQFFSKGSIMGIEYIGPFSDVIFPPIVGPDSIKHRYFTEDISVGTVVYYQLAKKFGINVPTIESIIKLGSLICKTDFLKEGRSLREMGIEDLTKEQTIEYIRRGRPE